MLPATSSASALVARLENQSPANVAYGLAFYSCSDSLMTMASPDQSSLASMRMGHLGMIESVVSRLSGHSATVKNFCITVFVAVMAMGVSEAEPSLFWVAAAAPALFMLLDAYYLGIEQSFRSLYRSVAARPLSEADVVDMDRDRPTPKMALRSFAVWPFYLVQSAFAILVAMKDLI